MSLPHFLLKEFVNALGYEIRRIPRVAEVMSEARQIADPVTFQYLQTQAILDVEVDETRGLFALGLPLRADIHPFVKAALLVKELPPGPERSRQVRSVLSRYYGTVRPRTALEAVDLTEQDAPGLAGVPAAGWLFPWADRSVEQTLKGRSTAMRLDALQYGTLMPKDQGFTAFGPVGEVKLELEVRRIERLVDSYTSKGFRCFNRKNPIQVTALRRDSSYRWLVVNGHHRFAACAAFSIKSLPTVVRQVVRWEDCEYWPQVVSGVFRPAGALKLFDRLFRGEPARVCGGWSSGNEEVVSPPSGN